MRRRLGIAQALPHSPSLLILDEPMNGRDPAGIRELRRSLRWLAQEERMAIIVSSHLLAEMELTASMGGRNTFCSPIRICARILKVPPHIAGGTLSFSITTLLVYFIGFWVVAALVYTKRDIAI